MKKLLLILFFAISLVAGAQDPLMQWDFENIRNRKSIEVSSDITDTIEGNFEEAKGVKGKGFRLDGFTTRVICEGSDLKMAGKESGNCRNGINHGLEGDDIVLFISIMESTPVGITILPL